MRRPGTACAALMAYSRAAKSHSDVLFVRIHSQVNHPSTRLQSLQNGTNTASAGCLGCLNVILREGLVHVVCDLDRSLGDQHRTKGFGTLLLHAPHKLEAIP
jgi:hypothetical protein